MEHQREPRCRLYAVETDGRVIRHGAPHTVSLVSIDGHTMGPICGPRSRNVAARDVHHGGREDGDDEDRAQDDELMAE